MLRGRSVIFSHGYLRWKEKARANQSPAARKIHTLQMRKTMFLSLSLFRRRFSVVSSKVSQFLESVTSKVHLQM